jgi:hypothetical protein
MTEDHAIRDCESRLRDEYKLSDFRHEQAEQVMDVGHHYKVKGHTKVDGKRYPFSGEVKERHVIAVEYSGPEPKGLNTGQKVAIGAAAAAAVGIIASQMGKDEKAPAESTESIYVYY